MIEERLGGWHGRKGEQKPPAAPHAQPHEIALINRADATQSQLIMGSVGLSRQSPDYFPAVLANAVLGGMFNSRLNMNLREDKGWTYGVRSTFAFLRAPGSFSISTGIRTDATAQGIAEIYKEIDHLRNADISEEELSAAKNYFTLTLPATFEGLDGIASMLSTLALNDLPLTYYRDLPAALAEVTVADVRRVIKEHVVPKNMSIVVVGDAATLQGPLTALNRAPVRLRDSEGQPVGKHAAGHPQKPKP